MKLPKDRYSNPKYSWLRVAIWEAYNHKDYYKGEPVAFREMEIDHIIPKYVFKNPSERQTILQQCGLPNDFQENDLLNFVPTRRGTNLEKSNQESKIVIKEALSEAKKKKDEIIKKIDSYFHESDVINNAAAIASQIETEKQRFDTIDIILHDTKHFSDEFTANTNIYYGYFMKATDNVRLKGNLPTFRNPTPSCIIEFRALFLRGITLQVSGTEVLRSLCQGNYTPPSINLRKYLQKDGESNYYFWTIANCIFKLDEFETMELCSIIDEYADAYIATLQQCECANDLEEYCLVKEGVRLFRVRQSVYNCIYQYITENHIYHPDLQLTCNHNMLRLDSANNRLHFIVTLENANTAFWHCEREFWVVLKSYYAIEDGIIDHEECWSPSQVSHWILDNLIPNAVRYSFEESTRPFLWKHKANRSIHDIVMQIQSEAKPRAAKLTHKIVNDSELLKTVDSLQAHFSSKSNRLYYKEERLKIYDALLERTKLNEYSYQYIASKLDCYILNTKESLIFFIRNKIAEQSEQRLFSYNEIELVLRCLGECIKRNNGGLGFQTIRKTTDLLLNLIECYNRDLLIEKYLR